MIALLVVSAAFCAVIDDSMALPTDVSGIARGVDAASFDPAAPALADGLELQVRGRRRGGGDGRLGVFGVWATPLLTPFAGFEWRNVPGPDNRRATLGLAVSFAANAALGIAYRRYAANDPALDGAETVDLGVAAEPFSWLTVAVGVDALNSPQLGGEKHHPALRLGAGVRPFLGAPNVTIGGEMRWRADPLDLVQSRVLLDVAFRGVHASLGYEPQVERVSLGLSVALWSSELRATSVPGEAGGDWGMSLTARQRPTESLLELGNRSVEVAVVGELRSTPGSLFDPGPAVSTLARELDQVALDTRVAVVVLHIGEIKTGLANVEEVRAAVTRLRTHGKHVVARLTNADNKAYLIASAADEIHMDPATTLRLDGFSIKVRYFADALAKLGVRFETVEIGHAKSGADPLARAEPRPEDIESRTAVVKQAMALLRQALRDDRGLDAARVEDVLAQAAFGAEDALAAGLVDVLSQPTDPRAMPVAWAGMESPADLHRPSRRWGALPTVAVVPVVGTLVVRSSANPLPGATATAPDIVAALESALSDARVAAVVVRVESGGGGVFASELVWRAVRRVAARKPVVVSMGDVAASGGYYLSVAAPTILASPNTITGSIGIFTYKPDLSGLLELASVRTHTTKEQEHADWSSWDRPWTAKEREQVERILGHAYEDFIDRVAAGRELAEEDVRELASGRVYTGTQALELGLVDRLGGIADAISIAAQQAGLAEGEYRVDFPSRSWSLLGLARSMMAEQPTLLDSWEDLVRRIRGAGGEPLALMPMMFEVGP